MDLLDRLIGHDAWTTRKLMRYCDRLNDEQLDFEFDIAHRSVRGTLEHIVRNVEVWVRLMSGQPLADCSGRSIPQLIERFDDAAADLAALARDVARRGAWDQRFLDVLDAPPVEKTFGGGIAHVITHSMHHRAQLLYMLRRLGVDDLPQGDVLSWEQQAGRIELREAREADLPQFFEHQCDPVACRMASFPPRDREAFSTHWRGILSANTIIKRTILHEAEIAGNIVCWNQSGKFLVGYWLGRRFWGRGIASRAMSEFASSISVRPLHAYVARDNRASIRVLEKCGFRLSGESRSPAGTGVETVEEFMYSLIEQRE